MDSASVTGFLRSVLGAVVAARQRRADQYLRGYGDRAGKPADTRKPAAR